MNHNPARIHGMSAPLTAKFGLSLIVLAIQVSPVRGQSGAAGPVPAPVRRDWSNPTISSCMTYFLTCVQKFLQDALAWKPSIVLLVVANRSDEDRDDLRKMGEGFRAAGAGVVMFDNILDPDSDRVKLQNNLALARNAIEVIPAESILNASPDPSRFSCLDHIHMTEPYHRLMAKQGLKVLVDSRVSP